MVSLRDQSDSSSIAMDQSLYQSIVDFLPLYEEIDGDSARVDHAMELWLQNHSSHPFIDHIKKMAVSQIEEQSWALLRNMPLESAMPATPSQESLYKNNKMMAVFWSHLILKSFATNLFAYKNENDGYIIRHVAPQKQSQQTIGSHGALQPIGFHNDGAFLRYACEDENSKAIAPEYLTLFCNRGNPKVATHVISVDKLMNALPSSTIEVLCKPLFFIEAPQSFSVKSSLKISTPLLIKSNDDEKMYLRYYSGRTHVHLDNDDAQKALEELASFLEGASDDNNQVMSVAMQPGDLMVLDNRRILHSRDAFPPKYDGTDRWLIRLYGARPDTLAKASIFASDDQYNVLNATL